MDPAKRVAEIIEPAVEGLGYRLVRVTFGGGQRANLQIMAERPDGQMGIEDCERLSHEISALLDVEDPIPGEYVLEVSSPGVDRPLTRRQDFERYAGFEAKMVAARPINGQRRFTGLLKGIDQEDVIEIETAEGTAKVPFALLEKAKLVMTEALLKAHQKQNRTADANGSALPDNDGV